MATNTVIVDRVTRRLTLLGGMAGFLVVALSVPGAFAGSGATFGLAYLGVASSTWGCSPCPHG